MKTIQFPSVRNRVLISGGAGFIGVAIAQRLRDAGRHVVILDRPDRLARVMLEVSGIDFIPYDIKSTDVYDFFNQDDTLIHLASTTLPATSMRSLTFDAESNIVSSLRLFESAINAGARKIIFASSGGAVYGAADGGPINEQHSARPLSAYGVSKLSIERYLSIYASTRGVDGVSLRIGNPYGPLQYRGAGVGAIARYLVAAQNGQSLPVWGDGTIVRDYLYIDDLADAVANAVNSDLASGEYNIGSGVGHSINDIICAIGTVTGKLLNVEFSEGRSFDPPTIVLDCAKFSGSTGWRAHIPLSDGVQRMWDYLATKGRDLQSA